MEDRKLIELAKDGSQDAFSELVLKYQARVFSMVLNFTRDRETADDLSQEIFLKAYLALSRFRFRSEFGTWLYRISLNHVRDYLRKAGKRKEVSLEEIGELPTRDESAEMKEKEQVLESRKKLLHQLLEALPVKYRIVLTLRDIQGLPYEEISRVLKISQGTVDSRLHRARKMLRKKLAPYLSREGELYALQ
ncbi:MAG: RNA polymerase sigma factor [Candidatus Aminicenantales bacterium]